VNGPQEHSTADKPMGSRAVLLTVLTAILWGGLPTAVRFSTEEIPPVAVAGLRFAMAAAFTAIWAGLHGVPLRIRPHQMLRPFVGGILLFLQIALFTVGIFWSNASHGSVMVNTFVFWVVAIEHFMLRTAVMNARRLSGLLLAAISVGMILLTIPEAAQPATEAPSFEGDLMLVISALILAVKILFTQASIHQLHPDQFVTWHAVFGTVFFAVWSLLTEDFPATQLTLLHDAQVRNAVLAVAYQGVIVAGFCFALQARLLQLYSASRVSVFSFATPLFGILFAVILRGDDLSPWLFVSGAGVATGIALVNQGLSGPAGPEEQ
jgi:drug/metabolite transporter (DMT)-like permease